MLLNPWVPGTTTLQPLPKEVMDLIPHVVIHLRPKLANYTRNNFGADSKIAQFENKDFESLMKAREVGLQAFQYDMQLSSDVLQTEYVPLSGKEMSNFVNKMNELLKWANIPTQSEDQLLRSFA
jgi:hypothetical protein